jgi:hypothetical protein
VQITAQLLLCLTFILYAAEKVYEKNSSIKVKGDSALAVREQGD